MCLLTEMHVIIPFAGFNISNTNLPMAIIMTKEISSTHSALPMTILATIRLSSKLRKTKYVA